MKTGKETRRVITIAAAEILLALAFILYSSFTSGNRNPLSDERLDDSMRQALHTLKRLDSAGMLYEMDVTFDYYSDSMRKIASEENYIGHEHGYEICRAKRIQCGRTSPRVLH